MEIRGIDLSHWNGAVDFSKVKRAGIDFCILKAGGSDGGLYTDSAFEHYYRGAKNAGLYVGAYYFVGRKFQGEAAGRADAERFLKICAGKTFDYPLFLDVEIVPSSAQKENTIAAYNFLLRVENAGCYAGFYTSDGLFTHILQPSVMVRFDRWAARYSKKEPEKMGKWGIWQYSSNGRISGITGRVDLDLSRVDYASIITGKGLNRL